jgi:hypothetical protein
VSDMTLYETTSEFRDLLDLCEEIDTEADPEALVELRSFTDRIIGQQLEKVEKFAGYLTNLDVLEDALDAEIKRLQARKQTVKRRNEQLREYALGVMEEKGFDRLDGDTASLVIRKSPPAVMVLDQNAVPPEFITVKTEVVVNKVNAGAALKAGREVPGCQLVQGRKVVVK